MQPTRVQPKTDRHSDRIVMVATRTPELHRRESFSDAVVSLLLDEAANRGWRLIDLALSTGVLANDQLPIGAIVSLLPDDAETAQLRAMGCPMVRIGRLEHPGDDSLPCVIPDYTAAGQRAVDYFVQRGFKDIALVSHAESLITPLLETSVAGRAAELDCRYHVHHFTNTPTPDSATARYEQRANALLAFLSKLPRPVALFCANSSIAGMINLMCQSAGMAVPEDVAILSLGDSPTHCQMGPVPLSAIVNDEIDRAHAAIRLLDKQIRGEEVPTRTYIPPRGITTRRSTDILAVDNPTVARTIRYIWDHLDEELCVDGIAKAIDIPRYRLERLFRQHLDRGVFEEVRRARLERFCHLLRTTDDTIGNLSPQVGYKSVKRLHLAFKEIYNQTPRHYRLAAREAHDITTDD